MANMRFYSGTTASYSFPYIGRLPITTSSGYVWISSASNIPSSGSYTLSGVLQGGVDWARSADMKDSHGRSII